MPLFLLLPAHHQSGERNVMESPPIASGMELDLTQGIAVLERTPQTLRAMLSGLSDDWLRGTEDPETWSPYTVVGHLIHGERSDWIHPAFGPVTLRQLLATWVAHDLGHVAQIARVMAKQYRDAVGPWRAYLPVMDR